MARPKLLFTEKEASEAMSEREAIKDWALMERLSDESGYKASLSDALSLRFGKGGRIQKKAPEIVSSEKVKAPGLIVLFQDEGRFGTMTTIGRQYRLFLDKSRNTPFTLCQKQ